MSDNQYLHEVVITAIVVKDGKYLVMRRVPTKKRFPGMWTVPGGRLETKDYVGTPKETKDISTQSYFGEPLYTYSLKQGIDDGFLAP